VGVISKETSAPLARDEISSEILRNKEGRKKPENKFFTFIYFSVDTWKMKQLNLNQFRF